jgi:hypothetical protein
VIKIWNIGNVITEYAPYYRVTLDLTVAGAFIQGLRINVAVFSSRDIANGVITIAGAAIAAIITARNISSTCAH